MLNVVCLMGRSWLPTRSSVTPRVRSRLPASGSRWTAPTSRKARNSGRPIFWILSPGATRRNLSAGIFARDSWWPSRAPSKRGSIPIRMETTGRLLRLWPTTFSSAEPKRDGTSSGPRYDSPGSPAVHGSSSRFLHRQRGRFRRNRGRRRSALLNRVSCKGGRASWLTDRRDRKDPRRTQRDAVRSAVLC